MRRRRLALAVGGFCAVLALVTGSCSPTTRPSTRPSATSTTATGAVPSTTVADGAEGVPAFSHVFVVVMENLGDAAALAVPQFAALAHRYQFTDNWYTAGHPSLPNYLALVSGSMWGISSDCTSCFVQGPNLGDQLSSAGVSWGAYFENMPSPCFLGPQSPDGLYAEKHDPFAYFTDIRDDPAKCSHLQPLTSLTSLLQGPAAAVPRFAWVTPNLCDDGHSCSASTSGPWLTSFVDSVTASAAWRSGGVLFVTWDEGDANSGIDPATGSVTAAGGGPVLGIVAAPGAPAGRQLPGPYSHYSLLRTIEDAFGLAHLGAAGGSGIAPMSAFFAP